MSKIICDVCGTQYPESAEQCPICGCIRAVGGKTVADSIIMEETQIPSRPHERGGHFSKSNVRKRNKNAARYEMQAERSRTREPQGVEEDYMPMDDNRKSNTILNVLLVIVIVALLLVTGYIFMKYFLPNILEQAETTVATETMEPTEESTEVPTAEPVIPCTALELVNGTDQIVLTQAGGAWLLNVQAYPEDTTDEILYISSDESVATVDEQGCVTAVGEGSAVVTAICGEFQLEFDVACLFVNETDPAEGEGSDPVEETEAPTEAPQQLKDVELAFNKNQLDMTFKMIGQQVTMKPLNGLTNQEITWISEDEGIITIDENGIVTCVGWGTTNLIAKYGDQEVTIICRCIR